MSAQKNIQNYRRGGVCSEEYTNLLLNVVLVGVCKHKSGEVLHSNVEDKK